MTEQEKIAELLIPVADNYNWYRMAGWLLKRFTCEKILHGISNLTDDTKKIIAWKVRTNDKKIYPYMRTIIQNNGFEFDAEQQKREDVVCLEILNQEMERRGIL